MQRERGVLDLYAAPGNVNDWEPLRNSAFSAYCFFPKKLMIALCGDNYVAFHNQLSVF